MLEHAQDLAGPSANAQRRKTSHRSQDLPVVDFELATIFMRELCQCGIRAMLAGKVCWFAFRQAARGALKLERKPFAAIRAGRRGGRGYHELDPRS